MIQLKCAEILESLWCCYRVGRFAVDVGKFIEVLEVIDIFQGCGSLVEIIVEIDRTDINTIYL